MPRPSLGVDGSTGGPCKVRKRGCSSRSSTSSVLKNNRVKRAILVGKRGGSTTPVPRWRMASTGSPSSAAGLSGSSRRKPSHADGMGFEPSVSARKLANALWEMNEMPSPLMVEDLWDKRSQREMRGRCRTANSTQQGSLLQRLSDPSRSPVASEAADCSRSSSHRRIMPLIHQKFQYNEHNLRRSLNLPSSASLMETETHGTPSSSIVGTKSCLKDLHNGLVVSKELLKILVRIWGPAERDPHIASLFSALRAELHCARVQVGQLVQEQRSDGSEISYLKRRFLEEKAAWKSKEQERIRAAVQIVAGELKSEKKLRRRAEKLNKKLEMELAQTKASLLKAAEVIKCERRSRELVEQVCNELVRAIGEDKSQVEELKRESVSVREELEKEREMFQLADEWREERVQMKLSEAKFEFEEKNAAVDKLRNELEAFLSAKRTEGQSGNRHGDASGNSHVKDHCQLVLQNNSCRATDVIVDEREDRGNKAAEEDDGIDSEDSDLHSIELNVDSNSRCYSWSYATGGGTEDSAKPALVEEEHEGRSANHTRASRISVSPERGLLEEIKRNFSRNFHDLGAEGDQGRDSDVSSIRDKEDKELDQDVERYISVKALRDHLLAGSTFVPPPDTASPAGQRRRPQVLQEGSKVAEMLKAFMERELKFRPLGSDSKLINSQMQMAPIQ